MDSPVDLRIRDGVAVVTLNRPDKRNALSEHTMRQLDTAFRLAANDHRVRALVLTGVGDVFCSGGDLTDIDDLDDTTRLARRHEVFLAAAQTLADLRMPTIAAVNGPAVGAGLALSLLCDFVVLQESAVLRPGFLPVGLPPDLFCAASLQGRVGATITADLLLSDRTLGAEEAVALRLVNAAVPDALTSAMERASELATRSPHAVEQTVRVLRSGRPQMSATRAAEPLAVAIAVGTKDFKEVTAKYRRG